MGERDKNENNTPFEDLLLTCLSLFLPFIEEEDGPVEREAEWGI